MRAERNQLIMSNTYSITNFWSEREIQRLHTILIVDTFSLMQQQMGGEACT